MTTDRPTYMRPELGMGYGVQVAKPLTAARFADNVATAKRAMAEQDDTLPLGDGHLPDVTDVSPKGELPVIDSQAGRRFFPSPAVVNPFRALVTEVLNIDPKLRDHYYAPMKLGAELEPVMRLSGKNPRRNAERKLVKAHGFRQVKKARQVARYILREQAARVA